MIKDCSCRSKCSSPGSDRIDISALGDFHRSGLGLSPPTTGVLLLLPQALKHHDRFIVFIPFYPRDILYLFAFPCSICCPRLSLTAQFLLSRQEKLELEKAKYTNLRKYSLKLNKYFLNFKNEHILNSMLNSHLQ